MLWVAGGLFLLLLLLFSIPAGEQCPKCEKYYTSHYKLNATRNSDQAPVVLELEHCHYCHYKWNITENGRPVDSQGNYIL